MSNDRDDDVESSNLQEDTRALQLGKSFDKDNATEEQIKQLRDHNNFSYEEEFYILYDAISSTARELIEAQRMAPLLSAIGQGAYIAEKRDKALSGSKLAVWFSKIDGDIPPVPESYLAQPEESLNKDYVEWGRSVRWVIAKETDPKILLDVWAIRFEQLMFLARTDAEMCAKVEASVFKTPENYMANHLDRCRIDAEEAQLRLKVIDKVIETWQPKWDAGIPMPDGVLENAYDEFREKHSDELKFLHARKKASVERINTRMESDPWFQEMKKKAEQSGPNFKVLSTKGGSIEEIMDAIKFMDFGEEDCGNPDCPIHGDKAKQQNKTDKTLKSIPSQPGLAPVPQPNQPPLISQHNEGQDITMATDNKKTATQQNEIKFTNVGVQFVNDPNNKSIQLPGGMSLKEGRHWLQKIEEEETRTFQFEYKFTGWAPLDAMWAAYRALSDLHGFVHVGDFQSWFGPTPPTMITIEIDYGVTQQMPWGPTEVSSFSAPLVPSLTMVEGHPTLMFRARIRNNEREMADLLMKKALQLLQTSSIYRGKAIDVDFEVVNPDDFRFDPHKAPKFWDTSSTKIDELILSKKVEKLIRTNIWTPIMKTAEARKHKIPLRRTTLLAGSYGVGKTLGARATAKIAQDNGWTFLYLRNLNQLKQALYFAKKYQPCVIFAEDINRITSGKRDEEMDALFNTVDGVDRKDDEVMLVFTTNDIEEIHPGMIRPGRIDTVITVTPPDAEAAERLIQLYGRGLIDPTANLKEVSRKLSGQIPAIIREAVERSKLAAIQDNDGGPLVVSAEHLDTAADQMLEHAKFLDEPEEDAPDFEVFGAAFGKVLANGLRSVGMEKEHLYIPDNAKDYEEDSKDGLRTILEDAKMTGKNGHKLIEG